MADVFSGYRPPTPQEIRVARDRVVAWLRWAMVEYREEIPTRTKLAELLGVTKGAVTQLLEDGATRAPRFDTLLGAAKLCGHPIDYLISRDPPRTRS